MASIRRFFKFLCTIFLHVAISAVVCTLLLTLVYMLPTDRIEKIGANSADTLASEGERSVRFHWCTSSLDGFTDAIMLSNAIYDSGEPALVQAMSVKCLKDTETKNAYTALLSYYEGNTVDSVPLPYLRYWHGYLLFLKPLCFLTNLTHIRIINAMIQTMLLMILLFLLEKNNLTRYIIPYILSVGFLMPIVTAMSLQFSTCYYLLTVGSIMVLLCKDHLQKFDLYIFLYLGISTAFFDFLTYPIATLGVPAIFYCLVRGNMTVRDATCRGVRLCFSWGFGYAAMWASKWFIGSIITGENIFSTAFASLEMRTSSTAPDMSVVNCWETNFEQFFYTPVTLFLILYFAVIIIRLIASVKQHRFFIKNILVSVYPYLILMLLPVMWYAATVNHSMIHDWFTHKALIVTILSLSVLPVVILDQIKGT